jgi:hypothetical protein
VSRHRGHIGSALLTSAFAIWLGAVIAAGSKGIGWGSGTAVGLYIAGAVCVFASFWAFEAWTPLGVVRAMSQIRSVPASLARWNPILLRSPVLWRGFPKSRIEGPADWIDSAVYGAEKTADVTFLVRFLVVDGRLDFVADNGTLGGDPDPLKPKTLTITFGDSSSLTFVEGDRVQIDLTGRGAGQS